LDASTDLKRPVGLGAATALVIGGTIGIGIFLTPAGMARELASPAWLFGVWAFMGASALCGALCFGELAARHPQAGGPYVYLREAFGPLLAFLYGWKCLLVMDPGLSAALARGFASNLRAVFPALPETPVALGALLAVAAANLLGVRLAAGIGQGLALSKIGLLAGLVLLGLLSSAGRLDHFLPFFERRPGAPPLEGALAGAIVSAFFSFGGWWEASKLAGEMKDARRTLPRALALGVAGLTLVYVAVSAVFVYLVPLQAVASDAAFAAQAGEALFGAAGARVLAGLVALFVLGCLFAFMTMAPRVYYAMARDGAAPAFVGRVDERTGAPVRAIAIQAALACLLVLLGTFDSIVPYFVFVTVGFLGLAVLGLSRLRRREAAPAGGYVTPLFPATAGLFLLSTAVVLALMALGRTRESALGLGVVALGVPAYYARRRARPA
jgi:APA family basic amino acid/polyamine antiporter